MLKRLGFLGASAPLLARPAKRRNIPSSVLNTTKMLSGVTTDPFPPRCQTALRAAAAERGFASKFWVTEPQARRTCNSTIIPNEKPATIYLHVEKAIPLKALSRAVQKRILDEYPPFFGTGVGILSERKKWRAVTAERLIRLLNKREDDRALFIDENIAGNLGLKYSPKDVIDVRPASSIVVYNAEQLDDPFKGEPPKGIAFDAITGKRIGQPAHDVLLAVGILRGYASPMWVAERQIRYLNLELRPECHREAVSAANMAGVVVPLSELPPEARRELVRELRARHPHAFGFDVFYLYNVNGWEATRSRVLVKNMVAVDDKKYPFHFVNVTDLARRKPQYAGFVARYCKGLAPIGPSIFEEVVNEKSVLQHMEARLAVQRKWARRFFFAEDATLRRYFNASCMKQPYLTVPSVRPIAVVNGRLLGRRDEAVLHKFALEHKLSSPLWLTEASAVHLGVHILPRHAKHYVTIGAAVAEVNPEEDGVEGFYNVEDFPDQAEIFSLFPKASKAVHYMLDSKWRPVLGKQRQQFLASQKRRSPLWVSVNECLMSGFEPRPGSRLLAFPVNRSKGDVVGTKLYNSQFTTDPVRVIGLSTVYTRPQGVTL